MIVALRFIRRHSHRTDTTGQRISFFLTEFTKRPSSPCIQTRPCRPLYTQTSCSMIIHYRGKTAGSWKISLAIPTTQTTQTCGCGRFSRTTTRRKTRRRRRHVKWFFSGLYLIPRFSLITLLSQRRPRRGFMLLCHTHMSRWRRRQFRHSPFAVSSRESTSKPREETAHTATIKTADKSRHASLGREDEGDVDPAPRSDIETRTIGPDRDRDQGPREVCPR